MERPTRARPRRGAKFTIGTAVIAVALLGLTGWAMSRPGSTAYYVTTSELASMASADAGREFRVNGNVVEGTVQRRGLRTTFVISDGDTEMTIATAQPLPSSFRDDSDTEVVARGRFDGTTFRATEVLAKCPSKFKAKA
ncbi:MAG TPA: cytochrome c maturation protein CcmE [Actinomycetota bacterium]|nr:cytochrome c maturation protein CcmE [Actinomycetota bacterium]